MIYKFYNYIYHIIQLPVVLRNQWRSNETINYMQNRKLRKIVKQAYDQVTYYKELFDSLNLKPSNIQSKKDLQKIPILTKDLIRKNYPGKILAKNKDLKRCSVRKTSGSSGNILEVVLDLSVTYQYHLQQLRQLIDIGYIPTDKIAYIRYSYPATNIALQKIGLFRRDHIQLTLNPRQQIQELLRIRPNIINAYPSILYLLARNITKREAECLNLKFILSNSELLYSYMRETIEDRFNCKVYNDYSCLEFSSIGFECREQNLHIACDNVIIEVVDDMGGPVPDGQEGRLIITSLNNKAMPYLRYEIGDIGALSPEKCPCGRGFPVFKTLRGRCDDFLLMPDGSLLDPQTVVFQIETIPEVMEFQILQKKQNSLQINLIIKDGSDGEKVKMEAVSNLKRVISQCMYTTVHIKEKLQRGSTGKIRSVISLVSRTE